MKALIIAAVAAASLSAGAFGVQAQDETDRAMGAGSYVNPNGPVKGVWSDATSRIHYVVGAVKHKKR